jgi:gamma-tubulin complex component 2
LALITKCLETISGDPTAKSLLTSLLRDASRPYMTMLNEWLHYGSIKDHHAKFLIREQTSIRRERLEENYTDEYWGRRYTLRQVSISRSVLSSRVLRAIYSLASVGANYS